jgi:predicted  nucleic acid-binding Zn-ribbon protein
MNKKVGSAEKAIKEVNEKVGQLESKMADEMGKMSSKVEALQKEMDAKLESNSQSGHCDD